MDGVAEVDRGRIHQRREARLVDVVQRHSRLCKQRNDIGAAGDRGPVEQVYPGAFRESDVRTSANELADNIGMIERDGLRQAGSRLRICAAVQQQLNVRKRLRSLRRNTMGGRRTGLHREESASAPASISSRREAAVPR